MCIVRVVAVYREGGLRHEDCRFVLLCGINSDHQIEDGEWLGYIRNETVFYPFILRNGQSCFYGGEEHEFEPTNIGDRLLEVGGFFTVSSPPGEVESWESTYEIVSCHAYQS